MEEKPKSVVMNGITYGVITGIVMILFSLILYLLDQTFNSSITWISYLFLIGGIVWGTLEYRKKELKGFMTYGKAFSTSFMIGLFAAILGSIYTFLFFQVIAPDAVQEIMAISRQQAAERSPQLSEEELDRAMELGAFFMSPVWMTVWGLVVNVISSVVIALITSIFIKKEDTSANLPTA